MFRPSRPLVLCVALAFLAGCDSEQASTGEPADAASVEPADGGPCRAGTTSPCVPESDPDGCGGEQVCDRGSWGPCVARTAEAELCNDLDDDCDGEIDEDFTDLGAACDGDDSDLCANGTFTCAANGAGLECVNETQVDLVEECNGLDDDCDAEIDEDFPELGAICDGEDSDQCANGTLTCTANRGGLECVNE